ncbi:hypothetical protein ETD86_40870 [Nonomuraea turkmeniaca]|uniref:Uncharacterized protein n=1 Tax=Nonomuraea turkmeniaca TaxID=103838 RepID=A0A5S4F2N7_9ACTN|nr:hypothetical protein [Nonomuraea turkmeniaca]TMR10080.1 hypothetical protein ETD86_40870 [Nonomuraea turkmeniaca]
MPKTATPDTPTMQLKVGDEVRIFDVNAKRMGQPEGGWVGKVTKVGRTLITVHYSGGYKKVFRRDDGYANDNYRHQHIETPEMAARKTQREDAIATLRSHGIDLAYGHRFTNEHLEQMIALLGTFTWDE